ncbi:MULTISPECIES: hypothetical protein [Pseudomonas]|uniref:Uncharacterized protein n=2 Tax=Pseudomonas TaxID=286 RepID=A0A9X8QLV3_9PSED|nr:MULTISPECIES: hypothetical protein [Pseudomonas]SER40580.1 hypothetical protein SAMN05216409_11967 [Pseudomonas lutea]
MTPSINTDSFKMTTLFELISLLHTAVRLDGFSLTEDRLVEIIADIANELDDTGPAPYLHSALIDPIEPMEPICWVTLYMTLLPAVGKELGLLASDSKDPRVWINDNMKHLQNLVSEWSRNAELVMAEINQAMNDQVGFDASDISERIAKTGETVEQTEARLYAERAGLKIVH